MNYKERQSRAEMLVKAFREQGEKHHVLCDSIYTGNQIANEIENMTDFGKAVVSVGGFVFQAKR